MTPALALPFLLLLAAGLLFHLSRRRQRGTLPSMATSLAVGSGLCLGILSLALFYWRLLHVWEWIGFRFFLTGLLALLLGRQLLPPGGEGHPPARPRRDRWWWVAAGLLGVTSASLVAGFQALLRRHPFGSYDAIAMWNARGLFLHRAETDLREIFSHFTLAHPGYPLGLPSFLAAQYRVWGGDSPQIAQATALAVTLAAGAALYAAVSRYGHPSWAGVATALFLATPHTWTWGSSQCADLPLALFLILAVFCLATTLQGADGFRAPPFLGGLFLGLLPWTKNEGALLALVAGVCFALALAAGGRRDRSRLLALLETGLGALPGVAALVLFKLFWAPREELQHFLLGALERVLEPSRWRLVADGFWSQLTHVEGWGVLWGLVLVAALTGLVGRTREEPARRFVCGTTLGCHLVWFGVYLATPLDPEWHLATSLDRLLLQLVPLTLFAVFAWLAPPGLPRGRPAAGD